MSTRQPGQVRATTLMKPISSSFFSISTATAAIAVIIIIISTTPVDSAASLQVDDDEALQWQNIGGILIYYSRKCLF
jgi:hypothetical protein